MRKVVKNLVHLPFNSSKITQIILSEKSEKVLANFFCTRLETKIKISVNEK
jgi:hypothetical protein